MTVKFAQQPDVEKIRSAMLHSPKIKGEVTVQNLTSGTENMVQVGTEAPGETQMNLNRDDMADVLYSAFGGQAGKLDFNNAGSAALVDRLRDALARNSVAMSEPELQKFVTEVLSVRDRDHSGLITDFNQLSSVPGMNPAIMNTLRQETYLAPFHIAGTQMVGPKVGAELRTKAILATLYALAGMLVYIAFRFEWIYGLGAVIACFHDTIITIGLFSIFNKEITMTVIAALLTLVGYSMNDTIVIFDRMRENLKFSRREPLETVMNRAVNQTLSRTVMTSGLTFLTVIALYLFGGPVLNGFAFALVCGILVGTYSSVFVASPIVLFWHNYYDQRQRRTAPASVLSSAARTETGRKSPTKAVK